MSLFKKNKKPKCPYCGNNSTNHFLAYITQSTAVPALPLIRLASYLENSFTIGLVKIIFTPYIYFFQFIRFIRFSKDSSKANTERSQVIWDEAKKRGIEMEQIILIDKPIEHYRAKLNGSWKYFESLPVPAKLHSRSYAWMDDKGLFKKKLLAANLPTPKGGSVSSWSAALKQFSKIDKPVITKPQLGSRGRHTTTHIYNEKELREGYEIAKKLCHYVILEEHLVGSVYRATYVGGEIVGILRGDPPRITGNGEKTIRELIEEKNKHKHEKVKDVVVDKKLEAFLERQVYTLESILPRGKILDLSEKIGTSYGGFSAEMISVTHPKILSELKRAGDLLGAPVVGFDFIVDDPTKDPEENGVIKKWGIIEANSLPFINLHHFPLEGEPVNVAGKVWDLWNK